MPLKKNMMKTSKAKGPYSGGTKPKKSKLMGKKPGKFGSSANKGKKAVTADKQYSKAFHKAFPS